LRGAWRAWRDRLGRRPVPHERYALAFLVLGFAQARDCVRSDAAVLLVAAAHVVMEGAVVIVHPAPAAAAVDDDVAVDP
jgi:hypothetical protein